MDFFFEYAKSDLHEDFISRAENIKQEKQLMLDIPGNKLLADVFNRHANQAYDCIQSRVFEFNKNLDASCSTTLPSDSTNRSKSRTQNIGKLWPFIAFNIVPSESRTLVSYSSLSDFSSETKQFYSDLGNNLQEERLNTHAFTESEDTCISPRLWEGLNTEERNVLNEHALSDGAHDVASRLPRVIKL